MKNAFAKLSYKLSDLLADTKAAAALIPDDERQIKRLDAMCGYDGLVYDSYLKHDIRRIRRAIVPDMFRYPLAVGRPILGEYLNAVAIKFNARTDARADRMARHSGFMRLLARTRFARRCISVNVAYDMIDCMNPWSADIDYWFSRLPAFDEGDEQAQERVRALCLALLIVDPLFYVGVVCTAHRLSRV